MRLIKFSGDSRNKVFTYFTITITTLREDTYDLTIGINESLKEATGL